MNTKHLGLVALGIILAGSVLTFFAFGKIFIDDTEPANVHPSVVPMSETAQFNVSSSGEFFEGYNLFVLDRADDEGGLDSILIVDMNGNIIREREISYDGTSIVGMPIEFINSTTILTADSGGAQFWNIYTNATHQPGIDGHHEYEYNPTDNTIFTFNPVLRSSDGTIFECDVIREFDLQGNLVWSLDTSNFISFDQWCPYEDRLAGNPDLTHCNTIFYDADEDVIYMNSRNTNTFYKIDHSTGDVEWGLGEYGDFRLFDSNGHERTNLFYHAHAVEKIDDNRFILFDNDYHNQTNPNNKHSRIVEITIDEETMTANESWSWTAPSTYYSQVWGDADRLPNGNRLGTFGTRTHPNTSIGARIVEVNQTGNTVWEMNFPRVNDTKYGLYRMERIGFSPFLSAPEDIIQLPEQNKSVTWQTWYNYRPKRTMEGNYSLLVNGTEWKQGSLSYDRYWRETNLTFGLGSLSRGNYNLTLIVDDGVGHTTADSINVSVGPFYIERQAPHEAEKGAGKSVIWEGDTLNPLDYFVSLNGSLHSSGEWTGQNIVVDIDSLSSGIHEVRLELINNTELEFRDSFWLTVYPHLPPNVTPFFDSPAIVFWGENSTLSWLVSDKSSLDWSIHLNGTMKAFGQLDSGQNQLNWDLPQIEKGFYNVTLQVIDLTGYSTSDTGWFSFEYLETIFIASVPDDTILPWDQQDATLTWEVFGGTTCKVFKNGSLIQSSSKNDTTVGLTTIEWRKHDWRPGVHNVTLLVVEAENSVTSTIFVETYVKFGDAYADQFLAANSGWYSYGENAVGEPDNQYAELFLDYGNGYITLDMGAGEEIIDGPGNDFKIIAGQGEYRVYVSGSLDEMFNDIGTGSQDESYNLALIDMDQVRYVKIEYSDGDLVEIDSVVALNYDSPESDDEAPIIDGPDDFWMYSNESPAIFNWLVSDYTPWNYSIYVNDTLIDTGFWNGSDISFTLNASQVGEYSVKLVLFDVFGHRAEDITVIEVRSETVENLGASAFLLIAGISVAGITSVAAIWFLRQRYRNES